MSFNINEFACARCGNCCRGEGYVRITQNDIRRMAAHMQITADQFVAAFTRTPDVKEQAEAGDLWLLDKPGPEQECILLVGNLCRVHPEKPVQCVGFPTKWRTTDFMDYCEGMRR